MGEGAGWDSATRADGAGPTIAADSARIRVQPNGHDAVADAKWEPWHAVDHRPHEPATYFIGSISGLDGAHQFDGQWSTQHDHSVIDPQEEREEGGGRVQGHGGGSNRTPDKAKRQLEPKEERKPTRGEGGDREERC